MTPSIPLSSDPRVWLRWNTLALDSHLTNLPPLKSSSVPSHILLLLPPFLCVLLSGSDKFSDLRILCPGLPRQQAFSSLHFLTASFLFTVICLSAPVFLAEVLLCFLYYLVRISFSLLYPRRKMDSRWGKVVMAQITGKKKCT